MTEEVSGLGVLVLVEEIVGGSEINSGRELIIGVGGGGRGNVCRPSGCDLVFCCPHCFLLLSLFDDNPHLQWSEKEKRETKKK